MRAARRSSRGGWLAVAGSVVLITVMLTVAIGAVAAWREWRNLAPDSAFVHGSLVPFTTAQGQFVAALHLADHYSLSRLGQQQMNRRLVLTVHRASDASLVTRGVVLADLDELVRSTSDIRLLGYDGRQFWLLAGELFSVDPQSLQPVALQEDLPPHQQVYRIDPVTGWLRYTWDGEWMVDPATRRLQKTTAEPPAKPDGWTLRDGGSDFTAADLLRAGMLVREGEWLCLATQEQRRQWQPGGTWRMPGWQVGAPLQSRQWVRVRVGPGQGIAGVEPLAAASENYYGGALLRELGSLRALRLADPDGFLVLHRTAPTDTAKYRLTRVTVDGTAVWSQETGLAQVDQIVPDAGQVVLLGQEIATPGRLGPGQWLVSMRTVDGSRHAQRLP